MKQANSLLQATIEAGADGFFVVNAVKYGAGKPVELTLKDRGRRVFVPMGGDIDVEDVPGGGASFCIELPREGAP